MCERLWKHSKQKHTSRWTPLDPDYSPGESFVSTRSSPCCFPSVVHHDWSSSLCWKLMEENGKEMKGADESTIRHHSTVSPCNRCNQGSGRCSRFDGSHCCSWLWLSREKTRRNVAKRDVTGIQADWVNFFQLVNPRCQEENQKSSHTIQSDFVLILVHRRP